MRFGLVVALLACSISACSNTRMTTTWATPQPNRMSFSRPLVLFVSSDAAVRRYAEDRMASELPGALQSYALIPESKIKDEKAVKEVIRKSGHDGVIIMRIVAVQQQIPAVAYGAYPVRPYAAPLFRPTLSREADLWNYWGSAWLDVYNPGYYYVNQLVSMESSVYSVRDGELRWAGISQTINPSSIKSLIDSAVDKSIDEMEDEGLRVR